MHFEARHVSVVCQHADSFLYALREEMLIENRGHLWVLSQGHAKRMHRLISKLHQIGFFVSHREQNRVNYSLEVVFILHEQSARAVFDDVQNQPKVTISELRVSRSVLLNHAESWLAQALHNGWQEVRHEIPGVL